MAYTFTRTGAQIEEIHNTVDNLPNIVSNENLIYNASFESAGSVANPPDATSRNYNSGDELFQGMFAAGPLTGVTYVNGKANGTGQLYTDVYKSEKQKLSTTSYVASIAGSDGSPVESGASFTDSGDYWRVTFDMSDTFSVKFELGGVATGHGISIGGETKTFPSVFTDSTYSELSVSGVSVGDLVVCEDYAPGNNSGVLFFKVVAAGTGTADGGKYIDLSGGAIQLEQNLSIPYNVKAWGAIPDYDYLTNTGTDNSSNFQATIDYIKTRSSIRPDGFPVTHPFFDKDATLYVPAGFYAAGDLWFGVDVTDPATTDVSAICKNIIMDDGAVIINNKPGKPIADLTGAFNVRWKGGTLWSPSGTPALTGMLLSRSGDNPINPSAGNHFFFDVRILGDYTVSCVYDYASEINHWTGCDLANLTGKCIIYATGNNAKEQVTSTHTTIAQTYQSCYGDFYTDCTMNLSSTVQDPLSSVILLESISFAPRVNFGYYDTSRDIYAPYFRFVKADGLTGTQAITQNPVITGATFEQENSPILSIEAEVSGAYIHGNSLGTQSGIAQIVVSSTGKFDAFDVQKYTGDAISNETVIEVNVDGEVAREKLEYYQTPIVFRSTWTLTESQLTLDGTWRDIDVNNLAGVPLTAKKVTFKCVAKNATIAELTDQRFRGSNDSTSEEFINQPQVANMPSYQLGECGVVGGVIQYKGAASFSTFRVIITGYWI